MTQPPGYPGRPPYGEQAYDDDPYGRSRGYGPADPGPGAYPDDPYGQRPSSDWFGRPGQPPPQGPYRDHGRPGDYGTPGDYGSPQVPDYGSPRAPVQPGPRHGIPSQRSPGRPFPGQPGPDELAGQDFPTMEFTVPPAGSPGPHLRAPYQPSHQQPHEPPFDPHHTPDKGRAGLVLAVVGGLLVLALLGIGGFVLLGAGTGGGAGTTTSAAGPDTAAPATVADRWLTAMFIDKSAEGMLKHTCKKESDRKEIDDAIQAVEKAEKDADDAGLSFTISWSGPKEISKTAEKATVKTMLTVKVGDKTEKKNTRLDLVHEAGWKVCDAQMS